MADKLVSVNDDFDFPAPVAARQAARLGDATTAEGKVVKASVVDQVATATSSLIGGVGIKRILTTKNADEAVQDGDLLFLLETPRYFTDFSQYATGVQPADWTQRWVIDAFTVEAVADATGGKVLRQTATAQGRRVLSWNALDANAARTGDVEIVFKWRAPGAGGARAVMRGDGVAAKETGVAVGHNDASSLTVFNTYQNGVSGNPGGTLTYPYTQGQWYITRARTFGKMIYARTWLASDPEPTEWKGAAANTTNNTPGWVGVFPFGVGVKEYDWFGAAFDGGRAPKRAL